MEEMNNIDSNAKKTSKPYEPPEEKTKPPEHKNIVIPMRKRGRGKKTPIVVFRDTDEKDLR